MVMMMMTMMKMMAMTDGKATFCTGGLGMGASHSSEPCDSRYNHIPCHAHQRRARDATCRSKIDIFPAPTVRMWWKRSLGLLQRLRYT